MHWLSVVLWAVILYPSFAAIDSSFVVEIVRRLNNVYHFETFPIFSSHSVEHKASLLADLSLKLAKNCASPQMHFTDYSSAELRLSINRMSLSIVVTDHMSMDFLKIPQTNLRGMHLSKMLLVFTEQVLLEQLEFFLTWLWEMQFAHALVLFEDSDTHRKQIFTIDPYPTLKWSNRTDISDPGRLFMEKTKNLKQYVIEIPYVEDIPRVFPVIINGERHLFGRHANIMLTFAKYMNINLICHYQEHMDLEKLLEEFRNKGMELSVHSYSMFDLKEIGSSYPLETVRWCLMVPLRGEVPKSEYVIIAFDWATWLATCISVVYIALLMRFIDPPTENTQKFNFLRSMAILMYSPNMAERMISPTIRQFVFYALVFLLGFILSCIYSTYVTSFCTNMVLQAPIDTVEDLMKEHLRVMVIDFELEAIRERSTYGEAFLKLLYPATSSKVVRHRNNFDGHYAYSIRQNRWNFLDKQQQGLERPLFRLSNICFGRHYTMFPLQYDSYLQEHLDGFILLVMQAGLDRFWDEDAFRVAVTAKYSKVLVEQRLYIQQLKLDYFKHVYTVWSLGIGISVVCFAVEVLWVKYGGIKRPLQPIRDLEYTV